MKDEKKTKEELIAELEKLRWRISGLEKSKARLKHVQEQVKERTAELSKAKEKLKRQTKERGQIEGVLVDSEERFRNLSEESPNMIFIYQGGDILYVNRMCSKVMGYERDEFYHPDFDFLSLIAPESVDLIRSNFAKHQMGKEVPPCEYRLKTKGGDALDAIITTKLIQYRDEQAILGIITDITRRKRTEAALARAREEAAAAVMAKQTIEGMMDSVLITDLKGRIVQYNCALQETFGLGEEIIGKTAITYIQEHEKPKVLKGMQECLEKGFVGDLEFTAATANKKGIPVSVCGSLLRDEAGNPSGIISVLRDITERKQAEEEILKFKTISDKANYGVAITDLEGKIEYLNDYFASVHGYRPEELVGKKLSTFHNDRQMKDVMEINERLKQEGSYSALEVWHAHRDGTELPMLMSATIINGLDGTPLFLAATALDITEHKQAEEALIKSEAEMRSLIENAPDFITILDTETRVQFINRTFPSHTREDVIGRSLYDFALQEYHDRYREIIAQVENTGKTQVIQTHFVDPQGSTHWFDTRLVAIKNKKKVGAIMLISTDVTERHRAQTELKRSEETSKAILNASSDAMFLIGIDRKLLSLNTAFTKLHDTTVDRLIGAPVEELIHPRLRESRLARIDEVFRSGKPVTFEDERAGMVFHHTLNPVFDDKGKVERIAIHTRDITEGRKARKVLDRTLKDLEESNADLEQFAYAASHDLMAPLGSISGYAQLLAHRYEGRLDADADKYIGRIVVGVEGMQTLVEDILSFSRLIKKEGPKGIADCNTTLDQVLKNLNQAITESEAVITSEELPAITADTSQIVQLFQNLIGNAIKYRGDDPPRIRVSAERKGGEWIFSISDNGIGIEPRFRKKVFVLFLRGDAGRKYPGTGMGLALCRKIVERHGGRIWMDSTPGEGSTFYFTIPCDS